MNKGKIGERTICWDCARACAGCSWSREYKPVKGWIAIPTKIKVHAKKGISEDWQSSSYIVQQCPEFVRDSTDYGLKWTDKPNQIITRSYKRP